VKNEAGIYLRLATISLLAQNQARVLTGDGDIGVERGRRLRGRARGGNTANVLIRRNGLGVRSRRRGLSLLGLRGGLHLHAVLGLVGLLGRLRSWGLVVGLGLLLLIVPELLPLGLRA